MLSSTPYSRDSRTWSTRSCVEQFGIYKEDSQLKYNYYKNNSRFIRSGVVAAMLAIVMLLVVLMVNDISKTHGSNQSREKDAYLRLLSSRTSTSAVPPSQTIQSLNTTANISSQNIPQNITELSPIEKIHHFINNTEIHSYFNENDKKFTNLTENHFLDHDYKYDDSENVNNEEYTPRNDYEDEENDDTNHGDISKALPFNNQGERPINNRRIYELRRIPNKENIKIIHHSNHRGHLDESTNNYKDARQNYGHLFNSHYNDRHNKKSGNIHNQEYRTITEGNLQNKIRKSSVIARFDEDERYPSATNSRRVNLNHGNKLRTIPLNYVHVNKENHIPVNKRQRNKLNGGGFDNEQIHNEKYDFHQEKGETTQDYDEPRKPYDVDHSHSWSGDYKRPEYNKHVITYDKRHNDHINEGQSNDETKFSHPSKGKNKNLYNVGEKREEEIYPKYWEPYLDDLNHEHIARIVNERPYMSKTGTQRPYNKKSIKHNTDSDTSSGNQFPQVTRYRYPKDAKNIDDIIEFLTRNDKKRVPNRTPLFANFNNNKIMKLKGVYLSHEKDDDYSSERESMTKNSEPEVQNENKQSYHLNGHSYNTDPFHEYKPRNMADINYLVTDEIRLPTVTNQIHFKNTIKHLNEIVANDEPNNVNDQFFPRPPISFFHNYNNDFDNNKQVPHEEVKHPASHTTAIYHPFGEPLQNMPNINELLDKKKSNPSRDILDIYPNYGGTSEIGNYEEEDKYNYKATKKIPYGGPKRKRPTKMLKLNIEQENKYGGPVKHKMVVHLNLYPRKKTQNPYERVGEENSSGTNLQVDFNSNTHLLSRRKYYNEDYEGEIRRDDEDEEDEEDDEDYEYEDDENENEEKGKRKVKSLILTPEPTEAHESNTDEAVIEDSTEKNKAENSENRSMINETTRVLEKEVTDEQNENLTEVMTEENHISAVFKNDSATKIELNSFQVKNGTRENGGAQSTDLKENQTHIEKKYADVIQYLKIVPVENLIEPTQQVEDKENDTIASSTEKEVQDEGWFKEYFPETIKKIDTVLETAMEKKGEGNQTENTLDVINGKALNGSINYGRKRILMILQSEIQKDDSRQSNGTTVKI